MVFPFTSSVAMLLVATAAPQPKVLNLLLDFYLNYQHTFDWVNMDLTAGYSWQKFKKKGHGYGRVNAPAFVDEQGNVHTWSFDGYQRTPTVYNSVQT